MTVDELIEERKTLEQGIEAAIHAFVAATGLTVAGIDLQAIDIRTTADSSPAFHYRVKADVRL